MNGEFVNNGALTATGTNSILLLGSNKTVIAGAMETYTWAGALEFEGVGMVIDSTVNYSSGTVDMVTTSSKVSVINKGRITIGSGTYLLNVSGAHSTSWTNAKNSFLYLSYNGTNYPLANSFDTLHASATGDTVEYFAVSTAFSIKQPYNNQFYNLLLNKSGTGTITIPSNFTVNLLDVVSATSVNLNGHNVNISGNWADNGTITNNTGTSHL